MKIAVIGAGRVGKGVGEVLRTAGHQVVYGVREPKEEASSDGARRTTVSAAAEPADVIVLATPYAAIPQAIAEMGNLQGKILIDCTNNMAFTDAGGLALTFDGRHSVGMEVRALAKGAHVYKSFNQIGSEILEAAADIEGGPPLMLFAGPDDAESKAVVRTIISDADFDPLYLGPMEEAYLLEALGVLWSQLAASGETDRDWAFKRVPLKGTKRG